MITERFMEEVGRALVLAVEAGAARERGDQHSTVYAGFEVFPEQGKIILRVTGGRWERTTVGHELQFQLWFEGG